MSEHTPEPWSAPTTGVYGGDGTFICRTSTAVTKRHIKRGDREVLPEIEANTRLIVAAPKLLAACKVAADLYDHLSLGPLDAAAKYGPDYEPPTGEDMLAVRESLGLAIQKAEPVSESTNP